MKNIFIALFILVSTSVHASDEKSCERILLDKDIYYDYLYPMNQTLQGHLTLRTSMGRLLYADGEMYETPKGHYGFNTLAPFVVIDGKIIASPSLDLKFLDHYNLAMRKEPDFAGYWKVRGGRVLRVEIRSEAFEQTASHRNKAMAFLRGSLLLR